MLVRQRTVNRNFRHIAVAAVIAVAALAVCSGRVSYNVTQNYIDPYFSGRSLNNARVAVLPFLTSRGGVADGKLESERMAKKLRALRPDMVFVSCDEFENGFPARFDRRLVSEFYGKLYKEDILGVKAMDSIWEHIAQPYLLVYVLRAGEAVNNLDSSLFKRANVVCELWSRDERAVVWRASCTGVSDVKGVPDGELMAEGMQRLAEAIPPTLPNYGREAWWLVRESAERTVKVGFTRSPKKVFDEIDLVTAEMVRQGWVFTEGIMEDGLGYAHLFFERGMDI